jgi:hypothetical protein
MQKWRPWEAASEAEWGLALEREAVIRPLAEQERLSVATVEEATQRLRLSCSAAVYSLPPQNRQRATKFVWDLSAVGGFPSGI